MFLQAEALSATHAESVPLAQPFLNGRELELVAEVLRSGRLSDGPMLHRFEHAFAEFVGVEHAVAVSSSAAALRVAALCAGWKPGDEVITSPLASSATLDAIRRTGAIVAFADVDPDTHVLSPAAIEGALTPHTRGVMAVDAAGRPADMSAIDVIARANGLTIVQDSSDSLLAATAPTWSVIHSFEQDRQLAIGEGGVLCTDDAELARAWRTRIEHVRLSEVASALGIAQIEKLPRMLAMREQVAAEYRRSLAKVPGVSLPSGDLGPAGRSWSTFVIGLPDHVDRDSIVRYLHGHGIEVRAGRAHRTRPGTCRVARRHARSSVALPLYPHMSPQQQQRVIDALRAALAGG